MASHHTVSHLGLGLACVAFVLAAYSFTGTSAQANTTQYSKYNYTFVPRAATWAVASETCNGTYGGHLVSVHSAEEEAFLWDTFLSDQNAAKFPIQVPTIYPGNDGVGHRGVWIGFRTDTVGGAWEDRSPVDFTNWIDTKPDNFKGQEACVQIYVDPMPEGWAGGWDDISCDAAMPYICKKRVGFKKHYTPLLFRGHEYIWHPEPDTAKHAEAVCRRVDHGHLVSVASQEEMDFLLNAFYTGQPPTDFQARLPKGAYSVDYSLKGFWLGYMKNAAGDWTWTDKNGTNYTNWAPGTPDDIGNGKNRSEYCSHVYLDELPDSWFKLWNDVTCYARMPFICKRPTKGVVTTGGTPSKTGTNTTTPATRDVISWDPNTTTLGATPDATTQGLLTLQGLTDSGLAAEGVTKKKKNKVKVYIGVGAAIGGVLLLVAVVVGCSMMKIQQQPLYRNKMVPSPNEV